MPRDRKNTGISQVTLADMVRDLSVDFSPERSKKVFEEAQGLMLDRLKKMPWRFAEQIEKVKAMCSSDADASDASGAVLDKDLALRLLLTYRPTVDTEELPSGHHFGMAFFLLSFTQEGLAFISKNFGVSIAKIEEFRSPPRLNAFNDDFKYPLSQQTLEELLRSRLPAVDELFLQVHGQQVSGANQPIKLNKEQAALLDLLLQKRPLSLADIESTGYKSGAKSVSRLNKTLQTYGVLLEMAPSAPKIFQLHRVVRCVPEKV